MLALVGPRIAQPAQDARFGTTGHNSLYYPDNENSSDVEQTPKTYACAVSSAVPIHDIPTELIVYIFALARGSTRSLDWLRLTHVCRRWRIVALGAPLLWTSIPVEKGYPFLRACLERSSDVSVDVVSHRYVSDIDGLLHALRPHAARIRKLKFTSLSDDAAEQLLANVTSSSSSLEELVVQVHTPSHNYMPPRHSLPDCKWPRLRALLLRGVTLPDKVASMSRLVSLELSDDIVGSRTALEGLLDRLAYFPCLEHLSISDRCPSALKDDPKFSNDAHLTSLPSLQTLKLSAHASIVSEIFASLAVSPSVNFTVTCTLDPRQMSGNPVSSILRRRDLRSLARCHSLYLFVASNIFRVRAFDAASPLPAKVFDMEIECNPPMDMSYLLPDALCDLSRVFSSSPVVDLQVFGDQHLVHEDDWRVALARLPQLASLEVGSRGQVSALFQALHPSADAPALCPHLKKISVGGVETDGDTAGTVLMCLEGRAERDMQLDVLFLRRRPEKPHLSSCTVQAILSMVGVFDYR